MKGAEPPAFGAEIVDGQLYGRGAVDMKSGVACFMGAVEAMLETLAEGDAISLIITGDEEGPATDGTRAVLDWMQEVGERPDVCIVGEPTNPEALGDAIKIGRRGSITAYFESNGTQGHVAYPHLADNPVHPLLAVLGSLTAEPLDAGTEHFQASSAQVVSFDVGNPADNLIPATRPRRSTSASTTPTAVTACSAGSTTPSPRTASTSQYATGCRARASSTRPKPSVR